MVRSKLACILGLVSCTLLGGSQLVYADTTTNPLKSFAEKLSGSHEKISKEDTQITNKIKEELSRDLSLKALVSTIDIKTSEGKVTLKGIVGNNEEKEKIIDIVKKVSGVTEVADELSVPVNKDVSLKSSS